MPISNRFSTVANPAGALLLAFGCRHAGPTDPVDAGNDAGASTGTELPERADPVCPATLGVGGGALDGEVIGSTYWAVPMVASGRFFLTETTVYRYTVYNY